MRITLAPGYGNGIGIQVELGDQKNPSETEWLNAAEAKQALALLSWAVAAFEMRKELAANLDKLSIPDGVDVLAGGPSDA